MPLWFFFMYAGVGLTAPFVPVFLRDLSFSYTQIGELTALAALTGFLTQNFAGSWSDRTRRRKPFVVIGCLSLAFVYALYPAFRDYRAFVALHVLTGLSNYTALTIASAWVLDRRSQEGAGSGFASVRIWGSIGYVVMMLLGWVAPGILSVDLLFRATPLMYLGAGLSALFLSESKSVHAREAEASAWEGLKLLREPGVPMLLLIVFIMNGCMQGANSSLVLWMNSLHASQRIVHLSFVVSATIEIPFMLTVGKWSDRLGRRPLLAVAGLALPVRLALYSLIFNPAWIPAVQLMHGLTYSVLAVVPMAAMNDIAPEHQRAAGQGLLNAVMAGAVALGPLLIGALTDAMGFQGMYRALAIPAFLAGFLLFLFMRESNEDAMPADKLLSSRCPRIARWTVASLARSPLHRKR